MKDSPPDLGALQRWMYEVITHPYGVAAGLADDASQRELRVTADHLEEVILPSQKLSSADRLAVYGNAYYARLLECLEGMFPVLNKALGEEGFCSFGFAYLQRFPSTSYTLDHLADHFVEFLASTRAEFDENSSDESETQTAVPPAAQRELGWPDFLIDLSRLELAIEKVFDGPGSEGQPHLSAEQVAAIPADTWGSACLRTTPSLHLLAFDFPLHDYYTAMRADDSEPEVPAPCRSYAALWRREFVVRRLPISFVQYTLLQRLSAGLAMSEALAAAAEVTDNFAAFADALPVWFKEWTAAGLFLALSGHSPPSPGWLGVRDT